VGQISFGDLGQNYSGGNTAEMATRYGADTSVLDWREQLAEETVTGIFGPAASRAFRFVGRRLCAPFLPFAMPRPKGSNR